MKLTSLLLAAALLWASHVPASGQLRNVTDNAAGISYNANSKTVLGTYTAGKDDHTILANASAAAFTITLPAPNSRANPYLVVKKIDATANTVTLDPAGSATIDGASTVALGSQYQMIILHASATGWHILNGGGLLRGDTVLSSDSTGGNLGAANTLTATLNLAVPIFATMTNGSTETTVYTDDTPAAEWGPVGGTADPTDTEDTSYARVGSKSLKLAWTAAAVAGDGVKATITSDNLEANESIGMWILTSEALAAGDLTLVLTDDGGARTFNIPAVASANVWTWVEVDISSLTGGTGDAITEVAIKLSSAGATAHAAMTTYIDGMVKWDSADELALGVDVLDQPGSVRGIVTMVKADAGTTAHTPTVLTEGTDYFIHRESGNDFIVQMTDQSTKCGWGIVLHK
jgi:hypothetical protein